MPRLVACTAVGEALGGISLHTLRNWWEQDRIDHGEILIEELKRIHAENYSVYGLRKIPQAMARAGWQIGRDQLARLK